jgi:hypothetical protein
MNIATERVCGYLYCHKPVIDHTNLMALVASLLSSYEVSEQVMVSVSNSGVDGSEIDFLLPIAGSEQSAIEHWFGKIRAEFPRLDWSTLCAVKKSRGGPAKEYPLTKCPLLVTVASDIHGYIQSPASIKILLDLGRYRRSGISWGPLMRDLIDCIATQANCFYGFVDICDAELVGYGTLWEALVVIRPGGGAFRECQKDAAIASLVGVMRVVHTGLILGGIKIRIHSYYELFHKLSGRIESETQLGAEVVSPVNTPNELTSTRAKPAIQTLFHLPLRLRRHGHPHVGKPHRPRGGGAS